MTDLQAKQLDKIFDPFSVSFEKCPRGPSTAYLRENNVYREELTLSQAKNLIDDRFLIDLYIDLRHTESKEGYPDVKSVRKISHELYQVVDALGGLPGPKMRRILDYINRIYRRTKYCIY